MLELRNVCYEVESDNGTKQILKDINLTIDEHFVAITGPNGGGKSTLAKMIAGDIKNEGIDNLDLVVLPPECDKFSKGATTLLRYIDTDRIMYNDERIDAMTLDGTERIGYANCNVELTDSVSFSVTNDGIMLTVAKTQIFIPTEYVNLPKADIIISPSEFISTTCDTKCVIMTGKKGEIADKSTFLTMGGTEAFSVSNGKNARITVTRSDYYIDSENLY